MTHRQGLGRAWEDRASRYLAARGLEVLRQRYRCRVGELDLVCLDGPTLVVVEVRARASRSIATASESVDGGKRRRIINATRHLLMRHPELGERPIRFDVFSADGIDTPSPQIRWIKGAFDAI